MLRRRITITVEAKGFSQDLGNVGVGIKTTLLSLFLEELFKLGCKATSFLRV